MTHLRLIAPVPIGLAVVPGAADRAPDEYAAFWQDIAHQVASTARVAGGALSVVVEHARQDQATTQYATLDADSLPRPFHLLTLEVADAQWAQLDGPLKPQSVSLRVYQHGVAAVECVIDLGDVPGEQTEEWLDTVQQDAIAVATTLAQRLISDYLAPVRDLIEQTDRRQDYMVSSPAHLDPEPVPMWVSRALLVPPAHRELLDHWTKDAASAAHSDTRDQMLRGDVDYLMQWLNYGFVDAAGEGASAFTTGSFAQHWAGLRYAQVVYGSLDHIDSRLASVLARASVPMSGRPLEQLRNQLLDLSRRAEVVILDKQVLIKYMTRAARGHFDALLATWDYDHVVEEPVRFKIDMCHRRLDEVMAGRTARSGMVTDVILLGIAVTSIAGVALAVTEFGRAVAGDPASTAYDLGASNITRWFATQPIDAVLVASGAVSAILVALYIYFRRNSE